MSKYHLTEAYGELYNSRLTEEQYYDNLKFVDYLQPEQIEEVMESLIWEFMDYGDTLDEAVTTLDVVFGSDEVLTESLDLIDEMSRAGEMRMARSKENRERQRVSSVAAERTRQENLKGFAKRDKAAERSRVDSAARARRATRSALLKHSVKTAAGTVSDAMKGIRKQIANKFSNAKTAVQNKAAAALSKVGRIGRGVSGAVQGAVRGAKIGYESQPKPRVSRAQYELRKNIRAVNAKAAVGNAFTPALTPPSSSAGQSQAAQLRAATTAQTQRPRLGLRGLSSKPGQPSPVNYMYSLPAKTRARLGVTPTSKTGKSLTGAAASQVILAARKQRMADSVDYDLLTQYMIEDIIYEGFAQTEEDALYILECMSEENLNELASTYLVD